MMQTVIKTERKHPLNRNKMKYISISDKDGVFYFGVNNRPLVFYSVMAALKHNQRNNFEHSRIYAMAYVKTDNGIEFRPIHEFKYDELKQIVNNNGARHG